MVGGLSKARIGNVLEYTLDVPLVGEFIEFLKCVWEPEKGNERTSENVKSLCSVANESEDVAGVL